MWDVLGGILGGVGQFASGVSGLFGGGGGGNNLANQNQLWLAQQHLAFQSEAARNGIKWRVDDAKNAGLHPLYAIGAPTFNPSPASIQSFDGGSSHDVGGSLSNMGQGLQRAFAATRSNEERLLNDHNAHVMALDREKQSLQNDLLRLQIAGAAQALTSRGQGQVGPGLPNPSPSTAATGQAEIKPNEITSSQGDIPHAAAGPVAPSNQWRVAPDGSVYPTPEKNLQMDDFGSPGWIPWMYRNHVVPFAQGLLGRSNEYAKPPKSMLPPGAIDFKKSVDGSWAPVYPTSSLDRDVQRTRHNRYYPTPQYERYR